MTTSIQKILVPTDFSPLAACSFQFALRLAAQSGASVHLLHVVEGGSHYTLTSTGEVLHDPMDDLFTLKMLEQGRGRLADMAEKASSENAAVYYQVQVGDAAEAILETIHDNAIDLVVIGASGGNWLDRLLVGSTTEQVVQRAACPVITLKCGIGAAPLRDIVFAVDPDEDQTCVIDALKRLQHLLGARLHLLLVNTPGAFESSKVSRDRLRFFVANHGLENYATHVYDEASLEAGLFGFADEIGADLLAFGTHHQSRLLWVLGPNREQHIVNHATRPVWTFNPDMAAARAKSASAEDNYNCLL
jgi:nucleotide-binding universal stress UspA family protein